MSEMAELASGAPATNGLTTEFRLLGPVEVCRGGRQVALGGPRERATLAALLLRANEVATIPYLVNAVWERPPASPESNLRTYVAGLRRRLGPRPDGAPRLVTRGGYRLVVDPHEFDVATFENLLELAEGAWDRGELLAAVAGFDRALELWRGEPDAPFSGLLVRAELARLQERRLNVVERRCHARIALGQQLQAVVEELSLLVAQHPLRESLWTQLITALHCAGRRAEALSAYERVRKQLVDDLGIDPGVQLRQLHADLLKEDPLAEL
jgi:DNA-binding SARP family transcriptional activator